MAHEQEINTLSGPYTLNDALGCEEDIRHKLDLEVDFLFYTNLKQCCVDGDVAAVVAGHLGIDKARCEADTDYFKTWKRGSFNLGIPVTIHEWRRQRVLIRFPIPHKVGDIFNRGNSDEKIRTEAAAYLWIDEHCPGVGIPQLWGVGLSDGRLASTVFDIALDGWC